MQSAKCQGAPGCRADVQYCCYFQPVVQLSDWILEDAKLGWHIRKASSAKWGRWASCFKSNFFITAYCIYFFFLKEQFCHRRKNLQNCYSREVFCSAQDLSGRLIFAQLCAVCVPMNTACQSKHTGARSSQQKRFHSCPSGSRFWQWRAEDGGPWDHHVPEEVWCDTTLKTASPQHLLALSYGLTLLFSHLLSFLL